MKLTVKVEKRDKVRTFVRDFEDYGCINRPFDTEDFVELENAVILTVEEAKILLECACCVDAYTFAKCKKLFDCLKTRIELVEKCDA